MSGDIATIRELGAELRTGRKTAVDLAEQAFQRIEELDGDLHAFVSLTRDRAIKEARAADERLANDPDASLLCGIPYAVKDIFDVAGEVTMGGCPVLADNIAKTDSNAVKGLSDAGMVLIGKTRTSPLACEITGLNHSETPPRNPWKSDPHIAGGSSSGSGVAVAAGMVPVALGSDTAGSVRVPAALCGVTGHKTTLGEVGRGGVLPLAESFDTVGTLARSAEDAALVFAELRGEDPRDQATGGLSGETRRPKKIADCRIVLAEGPFFNEADSAIAVSVNNVAEILANLGATVERREVASIIDAADAEEWGLLIAAEAWRNNGEILEAWGADRDWLTEWIISGQEISIERLPELRAVQQKLQERLVQEAKDVDAFLMPTARRTTRPISEVEADFGNHVSKYLGNTSVGNYLNLCGISLPSGLDGQDRPIGAMILAPAFGDDLVLSIGQELQASGMLPLVTPAGQSHNDE